MTLESNTEPVRFQLENRVRKTIREVCCEQGEEPGFVRLHFDNLDENTTAVFSVELPPGVHVLTRIEWHSRWWNLRRKRDPMSAFEIEVGDDKLRMAARIVGAPADHARAVFTPAIRRWILAYRGELVFDTTASRRSQEVFEHRKEAMPPWGESGRDYSEVRIWVAEFPPEEVVRMFVLELIAIAQQFRAAQSVPTPMSALSGGFRGVQPVTDKAFEQARRRHEIQAYQNACQKQPRNLWDSIVAVTPAIIFVSFLTLFFFLVVRRMIESC